MAEISKGLEVKKMKLKTTTAKTALLIFTALLLVLSACGTPSSRETGTASHLNTTTTEAGNGLSLTVSISSTDYQPGSTIVITIDESNTLAQANNVPAGDLWPLKGLTLGGCGTLNLPFGLAILQGNYDITNFSSVTPLQALYDMNAMYSCPMLLHVTSYDFEPSSDFAFINSGQDFTSRTQIIYACDVAGSWTGGVGHSIFGNFTPGIYTVVGGDEWGTVVIEHFTIISRQ
jgi:hypothetical protein